MKADTCGRKLAGNKSLTLVNGCIMGVSGHGSVKLFWKETEKGSGGSTLLLFDDLTRIV
jgi:hypothetical protein